MTRASHGWLGVSLALLVALAAGARADPAPKLEVSALAGGQSLSAIVHVLRDPSGTATLEDAMRADAEGKLTRALAEPSFGFTRDAVWLRFDAHNASPQSMEWLLELAYPHLDAVDLYVLHEDGRREHRMAGDHLPFGARELDHTNFLFAQTTPAGASERYYLCARTEGALRVPLRAWYARDFIAHDAHVSALLWMFYGALVVMAWYNLCVALVIHNREYAYLAGLLLSIVLAVGTLSGHVFQYLLADAPTLANRALASLIALSMLFTQLYARELLRKLEPQPRIVRVYRYAIPLSAVMAAVAALSSTLVGQRIVFLSVLVYLPFGAVALWAIQRRKDPALRFSVLSYYALTFPLPIALLAHANVIPPHPLSLWAGHIGCAAYCVIASLALPVRLRMVSERLGALNAQLSTHVEDLKIALRRAEQATEEARRATLVKDEFMATMSHELRTPLNAIINVPQGLLEDFPTVRSACCASCGAQFVLDSGERIDAQTVCPDCQEPGVLRADTITQYVGKPAHTARFLAKIERSGRHLLQMVNGVLDFSKMEAGRLELSLEPIDVAQLLDEVSEEMSDVARLRGIDIALHLAGDPEPGLGDPVRLRQVLLNLLSNAIKFSEPGGVIDLRWRRDPDSDMISVTDRGIGIAPEDHARVFASFEQVHKGDTRKYGGTGLGLSISRSLVRMHGGELWVESRLGEGATFIFRIPRATATISESANHRTPPRAGPLPRPPDAA